MTVPPFTTGAATAAQLNVMKDAVNDNTDRSTAPRELDYAEITSPSSAFTTISDVSGLSVGFTLTAARTVRIDVFAVVQSTLANDTIQLTLADAANTVLQVTGDVTILVNNRSVFASLSWRKQLAAGSYIYKVRAARGGSGTCILNTTAQRPGFIHALDVT